MVTVRLEGDATLTAATEKLGLSEDEVDTRYGLVAIDPAHDLYGLRVTDEAARRINPAATSDEGEGVFSDPRIEPFGPTR